MIPKPFSDIGPDDIRRLVEDGVRESRTLDYKQALTPLDAKDRKVDFLKDVAALANTEGGDILFGVGERREGGKTTGEAEAVVGLNNFVADQVIRQLSEAIRSGLQPRLTGVRMQEICCPEGPVLHLRVERSLAGPHAVRHDDDRFYGRAAMENYRLDPDELRRLFLGRAELPERARQLRADRVKAVREAMTVVWMPPGPKLVLHIAPLSSFYAPSELDVRAIVDAGGFLPFDTQSPFGRYNIDGYVSHQILDDSGKTRSYTQFYRSGAVEAVMMSPWARDGYLHAPELTQHLLERVPLYLHRLESSEILPPYMLMVSLVDVRGLKLPEAYPNPQVVDRDVIFLPDHYWTECPASYVDGLKPVFDAMWQSAGQPGWPEWQYQAAKKRESR